jgi:thioester reductase-like protein
MGESDAVLLTGATGLLGKEILRALLQSGQCGSILVLIRAGPRDPQARFDALIDDSLRGEFMHRVEPVWADLEQDRLGLTPPAYERLAARFTHIIHSTAAVDFALPHDAARAANVDGTVRLVELAARAKHLKAFAHVSTAHVAGRRTGSIAENELEHQCGFVNSYEQTKYEAEQYLRERMGELPIAVYRSTTLIGDGRSGAVRQFNFFHNAIRLCYHGLLPALPGDPRGHIDLIATDWAAEVIRYLCMQKFEPGATYHVCAEAPRSYTLQALIDATICALESSPHAKRRVFRKPAILPAAEFDALLQAAQESGRGKIVSLVKPLGYFLPHLALPKVFDAQRLHQGLHDRPDLTAPDIRTYYPKVVDYCLQTHWGRA